MKKVYCLMTAMLFLSMGLICSAQTLVGWSFPLINNGENADTVATFAATHGSKANVGVAMLTNTTAKGKSTPEKSFVVMNNGSKSIMSDGWQDACDTIERSWLFGPINTQSAVEHSLLTFSTKGSATGPKMFNVEYKVGPNGVWNKFGEYEMKTTLSAVSPMAIPAGLLNKDSVYVRFNVAKNIRMTVTTDTVISSNGTNYLSEVFIKAIPTAAPMFSVEGGEVSSSFSLELTCSDTNAVIYYTLDGSEPTTSSEMYVEPLIISATTTVKAMAQAKGFGMSEVISNTYEFARPSVAFSTLKNGGEYLSPLFLDVDLKGFTVTTDGLTGDGFVKFESPVIEVLADTLNAMLFGGVQVVKNPFYCNSVCLETMPDFPIELQPGEYTATVSLVGLDSVLIDSSCTQTITFTVVPPRILTSTDTLICMSSEALPLIVTGQGCPDTIISVSVSSPLFKASKDTISSVDPQLIMVQYVGPADTMVYATLTLASDSLVKVVVLNHGLTWDTVATPIFSVQEGVYKAAQIVELSTATPGAYITYTTNGADPRKDSTALVYSEPIHVDSTMIIRAYAFKLYYVSSKEAIAKYVIEASTGIVDEVEADVTIYPNPAVSYVNIELGDINAKRVDVIAMNGQVVYSATTGENNFQISFEGRAKGVYFIRIATSDNNYIVKKVMKM